jgi:hypothetical protein
VAMSYQFVILVSLSLLRRWTTNALEHTKEGEDPSKMLYLSSKHGHVAETPGAMKLDHLTLDKVIDAVKNTPKSVLVAIFCRPAEKLPEYKLLVDSLYNVSNLLFSETWVDHDDDSPQGKGMETRYNLDADKFPEYRIYSQKIPKGLTYNGKNRFEEIATWIDVHSDLELPHHDALVDFEKLTSRFVHSDNKREVLQKATTLAAESGDAKARHYVSIMQKVLDRGNEYIAKETERISDILKGEIPDDTRSDFSSKLKVLNSFKKAMGEDIVQSDEEHV